MGVYVCVCVCGGGGGGGGGGGWVSLYMYFKPGQLTLLLCHLSTDYQPVPSPKDKLLKKTRKLGS